MAKKQQIILLHGDSKLEENNGLLVNGEVAIYNAAKAEDVEFYATAADGAVATFQTAAATAAAIAKAQGAIELELATLDGALSAETNARIAADNEVRDEFADADDVVRGEFAAADTKIRTDFAAADAELKSELQGVDEAIKSRLDALEDQVGAGEGEGALVARVSTLEGKVEVLNGEDTVEGSVKKQVKDAVAAEAGLREAADDELLGKINEEVSDREGEIARVEGLVTAEENTRISEINRVAGLVSAEAGLREAADTDLAGRLDVIEGEDEGSIKKAVADEAAKRESGDTALQGQIDVLNGEASVSGSVKNTVDAAINKFATDITDNGTIDTFKELVDYAANHGTEFGELVAEVSGITVDYQAADEGLSTRIKAIEDAKPVYEIDVVGEYGDKVVVEKTDNKYTLNFDAFVIDGGTY